MEVLSWSKGNYLIGALPEERYIEHRLNITSGHIYIYINIHDSIFIYVFITKMDRLERRWMLLWILCVINLHGCYKWP